EVAGSVARDRDATLSPTCRCGMCGFYFGAALEWHGRKSVRSPKEQLGIEEELHFLPRKRRWITERPMVSKSSGIANGPGRKPSLRTRLPARASRAVTLTMGFPALAMTKGLPRAASSTRRDKCVFA